MIPGADRVVETGYAAAQAILLAGLSRSRARSGTVPYED
jgi:hypothetical protein